MGRHWNLVASTGSDFDRGVGAKASIGLIALSVDRASVADAQNWLAPFDDVELFVTRVPMDAVATPESLSAMGDHLAGAAQNLVPGSRLDAIIYSCTSGTVAVGIDRVHSAIGAARPGTPVVTPPEASAKGLKLLGAQRLSLLAPYHREAANLVAGYFEDSGFTLDRCSTFDLDGDLQMNRLSGAAMKSSARDALHPDSDALFISCTGLRTAGIVADLEDALGVPVLTSNQAMSWHALVEAGYEDIGKGEGRLFRA